MKQSTLDRTRSLGNLHFVKVETLKKHMNTNSPFNDNVNYKIAVKCIKLH